MAAPKNLSAGQIINQLCRAEVALANGKRNLSTTMGHSTELIREQCPVW